MRNLVVCVVAVAVGAAAAVAVSARRAPALPPGWGEVVVLGRDDAPIEGVTLRWDEHGPSFAETDARGVARIDLAGHGDAPAVFLGGALTTGDFDESSQSFAQKLRAPRTVLRLANAIPFDVTFIDGRDGRPLHGGRAGWPDDTLLATRDPSDATIRGLVNNNETTWLETEAPAGFALPYEYLRVRPVCGAFVRRQRLTFPVWPAGRIRAQLLDPEGRPVGGESQFFLSLNNARPLWTPWTPVVADADGRFESWSLPLVPHATAYVRARRGDTIATSPVEIVQGQSIYDVVLRLSGDREPGTCGGARGLYSHDMPAGGDATLRLRVLRRDGSPARRARVLLRSMDSTLDPQSEVVTRHEYAAPTWQTEVVTDDDGRATRSGLAMSRERFQDAVRVILAEPGCTYTWVDVPLLPGGSADCVLTESKGEEIALTVVDREGRPVPWARVSAETRGERDWTWFPVDDGVQDVAPRTDIDGRIVLRGLPPGMMWIEATFCGIEERAQFIVGKPATLRFR